MTKRVRLLADVELEAIKDNALHTAILGALADDVRRAPTSLEQSIPGESVSLTDLTTALAGLLRMQDGVRKTVMEIRALGGTSLDEDGLFEAIAKWVLDNQIGGGFAWNAATEPTPLDAHSERPALKMSRPSQVTRPVCGVIHELVTRCKTRFQCKLDLCSFACR